MAAPDTIEVRAWGKRVGAIAADPGAGAFAFEYAPAWLRRGVELAPLTMPIKEAREPFVFPQLNPETFKGLPGLIADALPDKFGTNLIDAWLAHQGLAKPSVTALNYLAYMGQRGTGALEFRPATGDNKDSPEALKLGELVETTRLALHGNLGDDRQAVAALANIVRVGTSAGGARAKAVIAWNPDTQEIRSGQFDVPTGFEHWILKFDGLGQDAELGGTQGYGSIEYAYSLMAGAAGINMAPCRLLNENGRHHFMTKRWDRDGNRKIHAQTLCGLAHLDYNQRATHAYEQLFQVADQLGLDTTARQQIFRRMVFNVAAANCDDHTKNHAFILPENGAWSLSPAYDVTHAFSKSGAWTYQHQMSVAGKFSDIARRDFLAVADTCEVPDATTLVAEVRSAVAAWPDFARRAGLDEPNIRRIAADFPLL